MREVDRPVGEALSSEPDHLQPVNWHDDLFKFMVEQECEAARVDELEEEEYLGEFDGAVEPLFTEEF